MDNLLEYINKDIKPLNSKNKITDAQELFLELPYTHFPVTENNVYIGCIRKEDAETLNAEIQIEENRQDFERFYARSNMSWLDVQELFSRNQSNLMPVLDDENNYLGYFEMEEIIRLFNETPFLKEEGGIVVVQKSGGDFSMSQVAQIVESNNAKILGMFISKIENGKVEITLKTTLGGLNEIIQTFRRFEYEIISQHQEDSYIENLKDRSDYLDKYLNI
jgi:Mg/Co/Ni transporter MgtE